VIQESSNIRSLIFKDELSLLAEPGQFVMVWLPGIGEFPMSVSKPYGKNSSLVVKAMGEGSRALYNSKIGESLGIRGPYGTGFRIPEREESALLVGGGTGIAPILKLADLVSKEKSLEAHVVIGARSSDELPFLPLLEKMLGAKRVHASTDDGSYGFKGFAHEQVQALIETQKFDSIFCCGPEKMMLRVFEISREKKIPPQFSLERIMKCGIAICGSCCIQDIVLCRDGPVLAGELLGTLLNEFGHLERDKTGSLVRKN
jgi:dihydroorotate dehydrogenase electron transfer subunit